MFLFTDEDKQECQQGASSSDPLDSLFRDVLSKNRPLPQDSEHNTTAASHTSTHRTVPNRSQNDDKERDTDKLQHSRTDNDQSEPNTERHSELQGEKCRSSGQPEFSAGNSEQQQHTQDKPQHMRLVSPTKIIISQPIGSLCGVTKSGSGGPLTVRGKIETITDEEILKNCESEEGIRDITRFRNYQPGKPSKVSATNTSHNVLILMFSLLFVTG